jgi:flagellar basal-body rod modification protein FlgD
LQASGGATGAVKLSAAPEKATVSVLNEAGRVVKTFDIEDAKAGVNDIKWDGTDNGGDRVTPGKYTFQVAAKDKAGTAIDADMSVSGLVTGVYYENGVPELDVGGTRIPMGNLTSISQ